MGRHLWKGLICLGAVASFCFLLLSDPVSATPPVDDAHLQKGAKSETAKQMRLWAPTEQSRREMKRGKIQRDEPNPKDYRKLRERQKLLESSKAGEKAEAVETAVVSEKVLVILVEFSGTDTFTWTQGVSTWDPLGIADENQWTGAADDCSNIIAETKDFTYSGPLHNKIPRPLSAEDRSGDMVWTQYFSPTWYKNLIDGNGVVFNYTRKDGSVVHEDFTGKSVRKYMEDMSGGKYTFTADIVGWVQVPHSVWWYGADDCPGARSTSDRSSVSHNGGIPGAGNAKTLVQDALEAVKAANPGFDWAKYDLDGDGVIDRLWIIHAGLGEEDSTILLNRTDYGEGALWSHSSSIPNYEIVPGIFAGPYIMMPENCGISVLAHEYMHNLGADDLYSYAMGETSAGFWTLMADSWTGYPIGFLPQALDPWHLENLGWVNPVLIDDPQKVYRFTLGQASGPAGLRRAAKIKLPNGSLPLPVTPLGTYYWWGGKENLNNAMMTTQQPIPIPVEGATLAFKAAYDLEGQWDFLWVQVSNDGGSNWTTLTNANTVCTHDVGWIGGAYGFPDDLCSAGVGGFTGSSAGYPALKLQTFDLSAFANSSILLRFWYMTDWGTLGAGPFLDAITIKSGSNVLFFDYAESANDKWAYQDNFARNQGGESFTHNFYLQWRNTGSDGGYDGCLGEPRWRYGPANSGLLVWYNNNHYTDNEIFSYLNDAFGFGPKGRMLVVDAHPTPYRDPYYVNMGYANEGANVSHRSQMRDAPFSRKKTVPFTMIPPYVYQETNFDSRPAVGMFQDRLGYYPGADFVSRGPGYDPPVSIWNSNQWDASVVIPSKKEYGIDAPAYTASEPFRFACSKVVDTGQLSCYWYTTGLGYDGSNGNPMGVGGQFGWNARIEQQAATSAIINVWHGLKPDLTCAWTSLNSTLEGKKINGSVSLVNTGNGKSGAFNVSFHLSPDGVTKVKLLGSVSVDTGLKPKEKFPATFEYVSSDSLSGKKVIAAVDPPNSVAEILENNNEKVKAIP